MMMSEMIDQSAKIAMTMLHIVRDDLEPAILIDKLVKNTKNKKKSPVRTESLEEGVCMCVFEKACLLEAEAGCCKGGF